MKWNKHSQFKFPQLFFSLPLSLLSCSLLSSYVSAMVPVKTPKEYYVQQEVIVLFCETVERYVQKELTMSR